MRTPDEPHGRRELRTAIGELPSLSHPPQQPDGPAAADPSRVWPAVVAIVGPTGSGKSAVGTEVARLLNGEVVNADAFQVYRGMDIGTAKVTSAERAGVPHHLLDILDVTAEISAAHYQQLGRDVLADLGRRGVPAVVVGGSGLYVRALLDDLRFPGSDPDVRARWEAELAERGARGLHAVLTERDPQAAARILPTNGRRIVRALEVGEITGQGFAAQLPVDGPPLVAHLSVGLSVPRPALDERIARRVARMFDLGLVDEVRSLLEVGLREGRTASRALGYPQVIALVDGLMSQPEAHEAIVQATRRYARRQQRWFGRDTRTTWLDGRAPALSTAGRILALLAADPRTLAT